MPDEREIITECNSCKHKRNIPGNCHIQCANPDIDMTGNPHGINHGWFFYPFNFDPIWKTKLCPNYEKNT